MDEMATFGLWLKRRRKMLELTQAELATRVGCAMMTIQKIEAEERRPSREIAERLAHALAVPEAGRPRFVEVARGERSPDWLAELDGGHTDKGTPAAAPRHRHTLLPAGTVTFLFTDMESSVQFWEQQPRLMQRAIARHHALLRQAITAHHGAIVKLTGDGFQAAFDDAVKAVACVVDAQRALHAETWEGAGPIRIRMGLYTGIAEQREADYYGPAAIAPRA